MIDIDKILENSKYIKEELPEIIENRINYTLEYRCVRKSKNFLNKIVHLIIYFITVLITGTGIVFATTQIYSQYIKSQNKIESSLLHELGDGVSYIDIDLRVNDMLWNDEYDLYYKVIISEENYNIYKSRINMLPDVEDINFDKNFLLIVDVERTMELHRKDLEIYNISSNEDNTLLIVLKQKENPNYEDNSNIYYAIIDKTLLRDKINIEIQYPTISSENFINIEQIPMNYSTENAIKDGCIVIEKNKLLSNNINLLDNFVENPKTNEFLRIYIKDENEKIIIKDLVYKQNIYYEHIMEVAEINKNIAYNSYREIKKIQNKYGIFYNWLKYGEEDFMFPLVTIQNV